MMHGWVIYHNIPNLLLLLDYEKAFDCMQHEYMGSPRQVGTRWYTLKLVQGLLSQAVSKAHINGHFTEEIQITCGVRQGCPLSPLIFPSPPNR